MMWRKFGLGLWVVASVVVLAVGCQSGQPGGTAGGGWLAWWEGLSAERPAPNFLSPEEAMIRAAQALATEGWLDLDNPIYTDYPELLVAKVAEPVFVYNANFLAQGAIHGAYRIYAVDENDVDIAHVLTIGEYQLPEGEDALLMRGLSVRGETPEHFITQDEATEIFQMALPGKEITIPIAIRMWNMEGVPHSNYYISWYTSVTEAGSGRNASGSTAEYLLCASVVSPPPSLNISANPRAALSHGAPAWGTRIARIDEPLHLHEKLAAARARAAAGEPEPAVGPTPPVKITPVEF